MSDTPEIRHTCEQFEQALYDNLSGKSPGQLCIAFTADLKDDGMARLQDAGRPVLIVSANADEVIFGPLYIPGRSACLGCVHHWAATAGWDRAIKPQSASEAAVGLAAELAANAVMEFERTASIEGLEDAVLTFQAGTRESVSHPVFRLRNCACSLTPRIASSSLRVHCSPLTGIVQSLEFTPQAVGGTFHAVASFVSPLPIPGARPLLKPRTSYGRGSSSREAEESCIAEALERYSLVYRGDEPLLRAHLADVSGIDPRDILLYSERQYDRRESWNRLSDERFVVPERFDPANPIDWMPALDLTNGNALCVPAACCLMWYRFRSGEPGFADADTNGCASGRTLEEALANALFESIERDATAMWWYNTVQRPEVAIESFEYDPLLAIRDAFRRMERQLVLLDLTNDIGVPVYVAVAARLDGTEPLFAAAAHVSPRTAAWKAASEVSQIWFAIMHHSEIDAELNEWINCATTGSHAYLVPDGTLTAPPEPARMTPGDCVRLCVRNLSAVGLRPIGVDLSRPDVSLRTVRAIVPGLRHIWNRLAPGRLYDVPVHLGWLPETLREEALNSICCMI